jgi:hypothetical protein
MHEEIFNILGHKGNANQNDTGIPSHPSQTDAPRKQTTTNGLRMSAGVGENANQCSPTEISMEVLQELKIE